MRIASLFLVGILLAGCSTKTATRVNRYRQDQGLPKKADASLFPKFRLVAIYDEHFTSITDQGKPLLVSNNNWNGTNPDRGQLTEIREKYKDSPIAIYNTDLNSTTSDRNYLDSKGKLRTYLDHDPIQIEVSGKKVTVLPIDVPSDSYRYYSGRSGIYVCKISDGVIRKICDRKMGLSPIFRNEALYFNLEDTNGKFRVVKVGPECPLTVVLDNPPSHLSSVGPNEELSFGWFGNLSEYSMKFPGKPLVKMPWNDNCLKFFPSSKGDIPVGIAFEIKGGTKSNFPAMYAQDGSYIPLKELCPELKSQMVSLDENFGDHFEYAKNGYLAMEIWGAKRDTSERNSPGHVSTPWMEGTRITKTYILKEIR